jgi:hypothetical protein
VFTATPSVQKVVSDLLTFDQMPYIYDIEARAHALALIVSESGAARALIGGAPFLMGALESALKSYGIQPLYAFSRRESVETFNADGSVTKTAIFRHIGFIET